MRPVLFGCCLLLGALSTSAMAGEASPAGISVEGEGEVRVVPDRARLSLAAEHLDAELGRAEAKVNDIVRQYLTAASAIGVEARHLQSTAVQIQPETVWNEKTRRNELVGYRVRRDLQVTVTDLAQLGALLSAATRAGITYVSPPQLEASQAAEHRRRRPCAGAGAGREPRSPPGAGTPDRRHSCRLGRTDAHDESDDGRGQPGTRRTLHGPVHGGDRVSQPGSGPLRLRGPVNRGG
jgi:hypothetical protein